MKIYKTKNGYLFEKPYRVFCIAESRIKNIHSHDFFEMAYVYEGCGKHIGDCPKDINEGDFFLILPGAQHCTISNEKNAPWVRVCNLLANMNYFIEICEMCKKLTGNTEFFDALTGGKPLCLAMHDDRDGTIINILRAMLNEYASSDASTPYMMKNLFENLLISINRIYEMEKNGIGIDNKTAKNIHLIKSYIKSHLSEKLTLDLLAAQLHYNPEYFSRYFKKATGKNISEYLISMRINKAKELLKSTDLSISDICNECGYSSVSNFRTHFTNCCGISPKEYRKQE